VSKGNRPQQVAAKTDHDAGSRPSTCSECRWWKEIKEGDLGFLADERRGYCTESPPSIVTMTGPLVSYGLTLATLPACGRGSR
jgi:hypothetical protein